MNDQLNVTLVQIELLWENADGNRKLLDKKLNEVEDSDLIILPEMFTTGFSMNPEHLAETMNGLTVKWMTKQADKLQAVVCGSVIIEEHSKYFNRFIAAYPSGEIQTYDKKHLFTLARENEAYSSGTHRIILNIKGWKVLPMVCYDLRFPVWSRSQKQPESAWEYDVVLYVANWPKPRILQWDVLLQARAIENQSYCVGVNRIGNDRNHLEYVGHSSAYDFVGIELLALKEGERIETVILKKDKMDFFRSKLAFQKDADDFTIS